MIDPLIISASGSTSALILLTISYNSYRVYSSECSYNCAKTTYGEEFVSFIEKSKIFGSQFHPEKSHLVGLELIKNFCELE